MLGWNFVIIFFILKKVIPSATDLTKEIILVLSAVLPISFKTLSLLTDLLILPHILPIFFLMLFCHRQSGFLRTQTLRWKLVSMKIIRKCSWDQPLCKEGKEETSTGQRGNSATMQPQWRSVPVASSEAGMTFHHCL